VKVRKCLCTLAAIVFTFAVASKVEGTASPREKEKPVTFGHIAIEQGLSQSTVQTIAQDKDGFLWLGTQDGLNKFDGSHFITYRHIPSDPASLSDNHVRSIYIDKSGTLWVCTYNGGLEKFDGKTGGFIHYQRDPNDPYSLSHNEISTVYEDHTNTLWIGTLGGGINRFDRETQRVTRFTLTPPGRPVNPGHNFIKAITEDKNGQLLIGTSGGGAFMFNRKTEAFIPYFYEAGKPNALDNARVTCIYAAKDGKLWIGTENTGILTLDEQTGNIITYSHQRGKPQTLSHNFVTVIYEDRNEKLWIGTNGGGINIFEPDTGTFTHYRYNRALPGSLSHDGVLSIFEDNTGIIWIGTYASLDQYDPNLPHFSHIGHSPTAPDQLSDGDIRSLYQDKNDILWIGTQNGGLNKYNRKNGTFTHYLHNPADPQSLPDNRVFSIFEDSRKKLWIGTFDGAAVLNRETGNFTCYRHNPARPGSLSSNKVRTVYEDSRDRLWFATMGGGLNRLDDQNNSFIHYRSDPANASTISSDRVFHLLESKTGKPVLWIGTFGGGLNRFDMETETFTHFRNNPDDSNSLSSDRIFCLYEDRGGTLWIGTDGGGLNGFDPISGKWTDFPTENGLPSNVVYGILEDHRGYLWLSTTRGLSRYNPRLHSFNNYEAKDGLQNMEFNSGAYYKNPRTGEMFFGGINGVNSFFPASIEPVLHLNPLTITTFRKFNKVTVFDKPLNQLKEIRLSYKENFFSFDFVTPEFRNPDKIQYSYTLEGFDREWTRGGPEHHANYTYIPPGKYVFKVKSFNQDGIENNASIKIRIVPPIWQTAWFRPLVFSMIFLVVIIIIQSRTRTFKKRTRLLEQINEQLNREIAERKQAELLQTTLYKIARIAHSDIEPGEIYRSIHKAIGRLMEARNFYIALFNTENNTIFLPYFVDENDEYTGRTLKASRGLTEYVIRSGKSLLITDEECIELENAGEIELVGSPSKIWLGVPLTFKKEIFGAVVVQHYRDAGAYTEKDKEMLEFVSGQIASIIFRKREEREKEELKEKLVLSEKMEAIGRLAGGVAHDLNNVLSAIISYPEVMLMKLPEDHPMRNPLITMMHSGQRAAAIVQDLLTLARRGVEFKEVINWNDIVNDYLISPVFDRLKREHPRVHFDSNLDESLMNIEGSSIHLTKALMNLCSNAAEAIPANRKGDISITTRNLYPDEMIDGFGINNYVVLIISDNGVGISQQDIKRIFEPFYTKKEMGISGTGLGMTIVWNTVNDHNGFINVYSEEGEGTTFELYFPVTREILSRQKNTVGIDEFMGNGERILVIDDVQEQREILSILLNELGYKVKCVSSGEEAVKYMKAHADEVDILVLDMIMEHGMDGLDTYSAILKIKPGVKAIISSGFSETERVKDAVRLGAGAYLKKPYTLEKIGLALKKELSK
jgi:ligand-binding sensor domain-containing protein/signal transduction histidine kinase/ActR/RegA family two-component response regulator